MNDISREIWEQQPDEPNLWFNRFHRFLMMGAARTLMGAYNADLVEQGKAAKPRPSGAWTKNARKWQWLKRAAAYDGHLRGEVESEQQRRRRETDEMWKERQAILRERAWAVASKLMEKAELMLAFPVSERVLEEKEDASGRIIEQTIIKPAGWSFGTVPGLVQTADHVARLSCDMETVRLVVEASSLSDEELMQEAKGLFPSDESESNS